MSIVSPCCRSPMPRGPSSSECRGCRSSACRSTTRAAACSPTMSSRRAPYPASTTRRWTATRRDPASSATLPVAVSIAAGQLDPAPLAPKSAARILNAPVPPGADTVVMQEDVTVDGDRVALRRRRGRQYPPRRRRHRARRSRRRCRHATRSGRARPTRGTRRGVGIGRACAARRVDRDRRRARRCLDRSGSESDRRLVVARSARDDPRDRRRCDVHRHREGRSDHDGGADRERARSRRGDHDRRRVGRRPRLRARRARVGRRRARAVQGRDEAGQAVLVRHARRSRGVRAARQPGLDARRLRAVPPAGAARDARRDRDRPAARRRAASQRLSQTRRSRALPPRARHPPWRRADRAAPREARLGDAVVARRLQRARRAPCRVDRRTAPGAGPDHGPRDGANLRRGRAGPRQGRRRESPTPAAAPTRRAVDDGAVDRARRSRPAGAQGRSRRAR